MFSLALRRCVLNRSCFSCKWISSTNFPEIDLNYYCNEDNAAEIKKNIVRRKEIGDIKRVLEAYNIFTQTPVNNTSYKSVQENLYKELSILPNKTHPNVVDYDKPRLVHEINEKRNFGEHKPLEFSEITRRLNYMRTEKLGPICGDKSYYFMGELAELEEALIKYTVTNLLKRKFELVSVPDILPSQVLTSCGMNVLGDRKMIYSLDPLHHGPDLYLSGTAEMSLAGLLMNTTHNKKDLPKKMAAVSRCYRAEISSTKQQRGIYRVHQFTKVEMFAVTTPEQSEEMLEYLRRTEEELFTPLGFHMRVLDMPPHELGTPAYRKYDIEAWMPGRNNYGEISSCSNCTDYQSRRLHITYKDGNIHKYVHTLNGTACAVPRMLIALLETHQDPKGKIFIPEIVQPFMNDKKYISRNVLVPDRKIMNVHKIKNL